MDAEYVSLVLDILRDALDSPLDSPGRYNRLRDAESLIVPYSDDEYILWARDFHKSAKSDAGRVPTGRFLAELMSLCERIGFFVTDEYES